MLGCHPVRKSQFRQKVDIAPLCCQPLIRCLDLMLASAHAADTVLAALLCMLCYRVGSLVTGLQQSFSTLVNTVMYVVSSCRQSSHWVATVLLNTCEHCYVCCVIVSAV